MFLFSGDEHPAPKRKQTVETGDILISFSPDNLPVISKGGAGGKDDGV
jgi:hypothetical protein